MNSWEKNEIRTSNFFHATQTLNHLSYFGLYDLPFKCNRWIGKRVLIWDDFLNQKPCFKSTSNMIFKIRV